MIVKRLVPEDIQTALAIFAEEDGLVLPEGGGAFLGGDFEEQITVVDLGKLPIRSVVRKGKRIILGAGLPLPDLGTVRGLPDALISAAGLEPGQGGRTPSLAGSLVASTGSSPFSTAMFALDPTLTVMPGGDEIDLGELLNTRLFTSPTGIPHLGGLLITAVIIQTGIALEFDSGECAGEAVHLAAATWPSGRRRVTVGGWGAAPRLALDGPAGGGERYAVESAVSRAGDSPEIIKARREIYAGLLSGMA